MSTDQKLEYKRRYMKAWRLKILDAMRQRDRDLYAANRERYMQKARDYRRERRPSYLAAKARMRLKKYGLTPCQYDAMHKAQDGVCAICKQPELAPTALGDRTRLLAVDHCHSTGKVRGLLCHACNKALGAFRDSPESLRAAAEYIERHRE